MMTESPSLLLQLQRLLFTLSTAIANQQSTTSSPTSAKEMETPGFRFEPKEEQLLDYYLPHKICGNDSEVSAIAEIGYICNYEPWDLPMRAAIPSEDTWYFFSRPDRKYRKSGNNNRLTGAGYWKVTGKKREIKNRAKNQVIGSKRILVFYEGRVRDPVLTNWTIHEYQRNDSYSNGRNYVISRLHKKTPKKIANSAVDEVEPRHDSAFEVENPVTDITFPEIDPPQFMGKFLDSNDRDVTSPNAQQPEWHCSQGPSNAYLQHNNGVTDDYTMPLSEDVTSHTAQQPELHCSQDPSNVHLQHTNDTTDDYTMPLSEIGPQLTEEFLDFNYQDVTSHTAQQPELHCSQDPSNVHLQHTNGTTDDYTMPLSEDVTSHTAQQLELHCSQGHPSNVYLPHTNGTTDDYTMPLSEKKILGYENLVIAEVDICKHEPWDLPGLSKLPSNDYTWYFLSPPDYKFRNSKRVNRKTKDGYWKVTGKNRIIKKRGTNETIGIKKKLVFYRGRAPNGVKTSWVIHEFSQNFSSSNGRDFVLFRLKQKSHKKIDNSTINKGESSHDATSGVENPVTEIVVTEEDLQYLEKILSSSVYFNPPDAQQLDMCMEHGPPVGNLQNINSFTDNYIVSLSPFGTSDLQDNTTKGINSSTANQDVCSIDGSMPTLPFDSSPSVSFGNLLVDNIGDTYFNPPDAQQLDMCMKHGSPVGNLQNINSFTNNYIVPLYPFGTSDLQDNTTKGINSSTANQDVCSIDGSMPTLPYDSSPSVSFGNLLVDDIGDTEEVDKWLNSYVESAFGGYSLSNTPPVGNLQNINNFTDNYNVPLSPFGTSDLQDNTTKGINSSPANQDVCSIDGSMPTLPYDSSPLVSFGNIPVDAIGDTEEVDKWLNSYVESAFGGYSLSNT